MHSLTHSLTHEEIRAKFAHRKRPFTKAEMMNPDFTDILLPEEVEYLAATRIDSFNRDRKAAVREKARTFVDTSDQPKLYVINVNDHHIGSLRLIPDQKLIGMSCMQRS